MHLRKLYTFGGAFQKDSILLAERIENIDFADNYALYFCNSKKLAKLSESFVTDPLSNIFLSPAVFIASTKPTPFGSAVIVMYLSMPELKSTLDSTNISKDAREDVA